VPPMSRRTIAIALVVVLAVGVGWFVYLALRPRTLADDAEAALRATWEGDSATLLKYIYPREIELFKWTPAKLSRLLNEVVLKNYAGSRDFRIVRKYVNAPFAPTTGTAEAEVIGPDGKLRTARRIVYATDDGGKLASFTLITSSWTYKYRDRFEQGVSGAIRARIHGYEQDKRILTDLGVEPYDPLDPDHHEDYTWEEWKRNGLAIIERQDRKGSAADR
jgi:hypothetical protein